MATVTSSKSGLYISSSSTRGGNPVNFPAVTIPSGCTITGWYFTTKVDRFGVTAVLFSSDTKTVLAQLGSGDTLNYGSAASPITNLAYCNMTATGGTPMLRFGSSTSSQHTSWKDGTITFIYTEGTKTVTLSVSPAGSGTLTASSTSVVPGNTVTLYPSAATGYHFSSWTTSPAVTVSNNTFTMPNSAITVTANFAKTSYSVTTGVSPSGSGSLSASKSSAVMGDVITLSPSAAAGYQFSSYTSSQSISNNKFTMPAGNVSVTANFTKITYSISKSASPSGGGTVTTSVNSAVMGTTVTLSNTPASGYVFDHYTLNGTTCGSSFTMPAGNAAVVGYFNKLTTGTITTTELTPGTNTTVTLNAGDSSFTHQVVMSFVVNNITYSNTWNVDAGVTSVSVSPEADWAVMIPNDVRKTGGSLIVKTLKSGAVIGQTTISSNLIYNVPNTEEFYPGGDLNVYVLRTVDGHTYPNVGELFVQNKSGVRALLQNTAGAYSSTVTATSISVQGYEYSIEGDTDLTLESGLLTSFGTLTVRASVTDSRGRTTNITYTGVVWPYAEPNGTLTVYRCDEDGEPDPEGTYARYSYSSSYSPVGTNTLTQVLLVDGHELIVTEPEGTGDVLGNTRYQFPILEAHYLYLTLTDAFTTKTMSAVIPSQRFLIHFSADGSSVAIGQTASTGSNRFTIADSMTMYIGSKTLEEYIHEVVGI